MQLGCVSYVCKISIWSRISYTFTPVFVYASLPWLCGTECHIDLQTSFTETTCLRAFPAHTIFLIPRLQMFRPDQHFACQICCYKHTDQAHFHLHVTLVAELLLTVLVYLLLFVLRGRHSISHVTAQVTSPQRVPELQSHVCMADPWHKLDTRPSAR